VSLFVQFLLIDTSGSNDLERRKCLLILLIVIYATSFCVNWALLILRDGHVLNTSVARVVRPQGN
jgi:hypothetical protein